MSSPWAKIQKPDPVNLQDIMSEEMARDLQDKEDKKYLPKVDTVDLNDENKYDVPEDVLKVLKEDNGTYESDAEIARMLQMQFDKEHDDLLKKTEEKINGSSKVCVSFENYRRVPQNFDFESESEEEEIVDIRDRKDWDRFDTLHRELDSIPPCGYKMQDGNMITKHDVTLSARKNACKLLSFPPEFHTGDGEEFDLKLSNKVFNSLKMHSQHEQARRHRIHDKKEEQATAEFGLDEFTRLLLYKMVNNGLLEQVNGIISIGKEAVILHADGSSSYEQAVIPKECVIKVFKTTLSEFKQRDKYIKDDHRFRDRIGKQTARKTVHLWAEKEMANLYRLQKAGIPCPEVITLKKHVLLMSFIGKDHRAAPKLKDARMSEADYIVAYDQVVDLMKALFNRANLIHADLSEYNILWHEDQCYVIDVSQSVEPIHENAFQFLMRDCTNISHYFARKTVPGILSAEELFRAITGCDFADTVELSTLQSKFKLKPHLVDRPGMEPVDNFEKVWESVVAKSPGCLISDQANIVDPPKA